MRCVTCIIFKVKQRIPRTRKTLTEFKPKGATRCLVIESWKWFVLKWRTVRVIEAAPGRTVELIHSNGSWWAYDPLNVSCATRGRFYSPLLCSLVSRWHRISLAWLCLRAWWSELWRYDFCSTGEFARELERAYSTSVCDTSAVRRGGTSTSTRDAERA